MHLISKSSHLYNSMNLAYKTVSFCLCFALASSSNCGKIYIKCFVTISKAAFAKQSENSKIKRKNEKKYKRKKQENNKKKQIQ